MLRNTTPKLLHHYTGHANFPVSTWLPREASFFCKACRECLALKRNVVVSHIKCAKHQRSKEKLLEKEARERDLAQAVEKHDAETHRKGELSMQTPRSTE